MDPIARMVAAGAAGAAGSSSATYVDDVFSTFLYEGTGSAQTINNGIDLSGEGGLVWIKSRTMQRNAGIYDTERGAGRSLVPSGGTGQTGVDSTSLTAFNSNGFSVGTDTYSTVNEDDKDFASWSFRKAPGFFDIQTWIGNGVEGRQIPHNLGSTPGMIMIKRTGGGGVENWVVYHRSMGIGQNLTLNEDYAANSFAYVTSVSDTAFGVSMQFQTNGNDSSATYVAYIFAHDDQSFGTNSDESIIKCGEFTTDGSYNGSVTLGWEPQWVMVKNTSASGHWFIHDVMRGAPVDGDSNWFKANTTEPEYPTSLAVRPNATGFTTFNHSGNTDMLYIAIRRPHKPPTAETEVFTVKYLANGSTNLGFVADTNISKYPAGTQEWYWNSRLTGNKDLNSNNNGSEDTAQATYWDRPTNTVNYGSYTGYHVNYVFRRAPGFFDVVAYAGNSSVRTVNHNLTVEPEMMIIKARNRDSAWQVYHSSQGNTKYSPIKTDPFYTSSRWNNTTPTSTQFTLIGDNDLNGSGFTYIAYLFASLPGISKVGSYSGTGGTLNIDCGFAAGARFVLIKRADTEIQGSAPDRTNWYIWDTARGISSGNDPYLSLNTVDTEVTNTDYIDPLNAGFTVNASGTGINAAGGTYIFLAIA